MRTLQAESLPAEIARIRRRMEEVALVHPTVSFQLIDAVTHTVVLQARRVRSFMTGFTQ